MSKTHVVMIIPPQPIIGELEILMKKLNSRFNAAKALFYPPHITLKSLGKIEDENFKNVMIELADKVYDIDSFQLKMGNFRFFGSTPDYKGVYIPVERSPELLGLHNKLVKLLGKYDDGKDRSYKEMERYNPHLTLVGTDISDENLERAKKELSNVSYNYSFPVKKVTLIRHSQETEKPFFYHSTNFWFHEN